MGERGLAPSFVKESLPTDPRDSGPWRALNDLSEARINNVTPLCEFKHFMCLCEFQQVVSIRHCCEDPSRQILCNSVTCESIELDATPATRLLQWDDERNSLLIHQNGASSKWISSMFDAELLQNGDGSQAVQGKNKNTTLIPLRQFFGEHHAFLL